MYATTTDFSSRTVSFQSFKHSSRLVRVECPLTIPCCACDNRLLSAKCIMCFTITRFIIMSTILACNLQRHQLDRALNFLSQTPGDWYFSAEVQPADFFSGWDLARGISGWLSAKFRLSISVEVIQCYLSQGQWPKLMCKIISYFSAFEITYLWCYKSRLLWPRP